MVAMCCLPLAAGRCCPGKRKSPQPASTSQYRCFQGKSNIQPSGRPSRLTNSPRPPAPIKESLIAQGLRPSEVARIINVHRSTVYRELRRNRQKRQKKTDMRTISDEFVSRVERRLNLRPRKCPDLKQPEAVFRERVQALRVGSVALRS